MKNVRCQTRLTNKIFNQTKVAIKTLTNQNQILIDQIKNLKTKNVDFRIVLINAIFEIVEFKRVFEFQTKKLTINKRILLKY